jgi:hypothetical protein
VSKYKHQLLQLEKITTEKKGQSSGHWLEHKTQNTTHTDRTTNKMSHATLYPPAALPPLSPWVEQWRHQIMALLLPNAMRRLRPIRVALAVVGLLAWGGKIRASNNREGGLPWP